MLTYPKIETLYNRDPTTFSVNEDEYRLPEFEYLSDCFWYAYEKIDGTNIRVRCSDMPPKVWFGGRTDRAQVPIKLLEVLEEQLGNYDRFKSVFEDASEVVLFGEGYGGKIQNGGKYNQAYSFRLFDIRVGEWWLKREDVEDVAQKLGVKVAPLILSGNLSFITELVKGGVMSSVALQDSGKETVAEGVVMHPAVPLKTRSGRRVVAKLKTSDWK